MTKVKLLLLHILVVIMALLVPLGYAQVSNLLTISGTIKVDAVDDIFISKATVVDGTAKVNAYNMTSFPAP